MADKKISELTTLLAADVAINDVLPIVDSSAIETKKMTIADAKEVFKTTAISVNTSTDAFKITQTGTGNAFVVEDSASPDTTRFVIDSAGRTLIGHTQSVLYQPISAGTPANVQSHSINGAAASIVTNMWATADATGATVGFSKSRSGTIGTHAVVQNADVLGNVRFAGSDDTDFVEGARISAVVDGTPSANDMPARLVFSTTADGASTPTERMRIDSAGSVGIGATPAIGRLLTLSRNTVGATTGGIILNQAIQSDATSYRAIRSVPSTLAATFTLNDLSHFYAEQATIGAGSTVTNQYGYTADVSLIGATNNYGFYGNIASGTGRWNFYANGTADNAFNGNTRFGGLTAPTVAVDVTGDIKATGNISGGYISHAAGTTAMGFASDNVVRVTPNATATYTTTVPAAGAIVVLSILTSGTVSYTITFGTGFKATGTLATGTVSARYFNLTFVSDGTNLIETARTVAIA